MSDERWMTRRAALRAGGAALAALALPPALRAAARRGAVHVIEMRSDVGGSKVWFDPVGLFVEPGATIRWIVRQNVHTTTAYHPRNGHHSLRIPAGAEPWDSGYLVNPGDHFQATLTVPGVYDFFCQPHEQAGMVGRIIVGAATGPGAEPFDYFKGKPGTADWLPVPLAAQRAFPDVARVVREKVVHLV